MDSPSPKTHRSLTTLRRCIRCSTIYSLCNFERRKTGFGGGPFKRPPLTKPDHKFAHRLLRNSFSPPLSQWRPRINGAQHRVWMNVRLAQTENEWAAVRAVLVSFAAHLQPVTTPDAILQDLKAYAQQMILWWKGRNNTKRTSKRGSSDRHSDTSGDSEQHSASSDEMDGKPSNKRAHTKSDPPEQLWPNRLDDNITLWGPSNSLPMSTDSGLRFPSLGEQVSVAQFAPVAQLNVSSSAPGSMWPTGSSPAQPLWWNQAGPSGEAIASGVVGEVLAANQSKVRCRWVPSSSTHSNLYSWCCSMWAAHSFRQPCGRSRRCPTPGLPRCLATLSTISRHMHGPRCLWTVLRRYLHMTIEQCPRMICCNHTTLSYDTQLFEHVLGYLRNISLTNAPALQFHKQLPDDKQLLHMLLAEAHFFEMPDLAAQIVHALVRVPEAEVLQYTSVFSETGFHDTGAETQLQQKQEATLAAFNAALAMQQRAGWDVHSVQPDVFVQERADGTSTRNLVYHAVLKRSVSAAARGW